MIKNSKGSRIYPKLSNLAMTKKSLEKKKVPKKNHKRLSRNTKKSKEKRVESFLSIPIKQKKHIDSVNQKVYMSNPSTISKNGYTSWVLGIMSK